MYVELMSSKVDLLRKHIAELQAQLEVEIAKMLMFPMVHCL